MDCKDFRNKTLFYLDNELSRKEMKLIENHLEECNSCLEHTKSIRDIYFSDDYNIPVDVNFLNRVTGEINSREKNTIRLSPVAKKWLLAASLTLAISSSILSSLTLINQSQNTTDKVTTEYLMVNEWSAEPIETILLNE